MPSEYGIGGPTVSEEYYVRGPRAAFWFGRKTPKPLLYFHDSSASTLTVTNSEEMVLINALAKTHFVLVADWGGDTFANVTGISRAVGGASFIRSFNVHPTEPVSVLGMGMGATLAMGFAHYYPDKVTAVGGILPMLDLNDVFTNNRGGLATSIDTAYDGEYLDDVHGPMSSPIKYASDLPELLPVHLWTSSDDAISVPEKVDEFVNLRPATGQTDLGAVGHSTSVLTASVVSQVVDYFNAYLA